MREKNNDRQSKSHTSFRAIYNRLYVGGDAMKTIAVWFSCGAASAVAAMKTVEKYGGRYDVRVLNNFVLEEDEDNRRFLGDVEHWLGFKIEDVSNPKYRSCSAVGVWDQRNFMSGREGAPCTLELKKRARQLWEKENHADHHVLGFTLDEKKRHENFIKTERPLLPVLIDEGITKADCYRIIQEAGIKLPRAYEMGYPNANCIGCVKATSPTYWNHVRKHHPDIFYQRAMQSQRIGAKLTRCHPRYLDWCYQDEKGVWHDKTGRNELYTKDGKLISPRISLAELPQDAKGRPLKSMDFECGVFCEEVKL